MRLSAKTLAAMLAGLALTAFQFDSDAQSRSNSRPSSATRSSSSVSRSSSSAVRGSSSTSQSPKRTPDISPAQRNPSKPSAVRPSSGKPSSGRPTVDRPPSGKPSSGRPTVDRPSTSKPSGSKPAVKPDNKPNAPRPDFKPGNQHRPVGVRPPSRPPQPSRPPVYRPVRPKRPVVRPIIIRPSYGTVIATDIAAGMAWTAVNIAYFNTVARTYDQISDNAQTIAQQNAVIAQNNATIAAQNLQIAQSQARAQEAYGLANGLGLIQSYADAGASYYYQDGVFYIQGNDGQYYVIVPPAGALVETLPEDFETVVLDGKEYYKVDNTIYQMTINEGKPYFEVIGQMN